MSDALPPDETIGGIISQAAAGEVNASTLTPDDTKALADRIELLAADFGRWESYKAASTEYVQAFAKEVNWHRVIRTAVAVAGAFLIIFLAGALVCGMLYSKTLFGTDQGHALPALIVACVTGCVIVTIALIKGAFSNVADRNAGLPMPEHIKEIIEAAKAIVGGGHS